LDYFRQVSNNQNYFNSPTDRRPGGIKERSMVTIIKFVFVLLGSVLAWLIGGYTMEYFRPYKKK